MVEAGCRAPQSMKRRDHHVLLWWVLAFTVLLILGLGCWFVVIPVMQVKNLLATHDWDSIRHVADPGCSSVLGMLEDDEEVPELLGALGGARRAAFSLRLSLYVPGLRIAGRDRQHAVQLLAYCRELSTSNALVDLLGDDSGEIRAYAAWGLGELGAGAEVVVPHLGNLLQRSGVTDAEKVVAIGAITKIGGRHAQEALPAVRSNLVSGNEEVRLNAAWSVWKLSGEAAPMVAMARSALHPDGDTERWYLAMELLCQLGPQAQDAVPELVSFLSGAAAEAIRTRSEIAAQQVKDAHASVVNSLDELPPGAKSALPSIEDAFSALKDSTVQDIQDARIVAMDTLGEIGPGASAAIPALEAALSEENADARSAAADALKKIRGEETPK